jgi:hypothetical protein
VLTLIFNSVTTNLDDFDWEEMEKTVAGGGQKKKRNFFKEKGQVDSASAAHSWQKQQFKDRQLVTRTIS